MFKDINKALFLVDHNKVHRDYQIMAQHKHPSNNNPCYISLIEPTYEVICVYLVWEL